MVPRPRLFGVVEAETSVAALAACAAGPVQPVAGGGRFQNLIAIVIIKWPTDAGDRGRCNSFAQGQLRPGSGFSFLGNTDVHFVGYVRFTP